MKTIVFGIVAALACLSYVQAQAPLWIDFRAKFDLVAWNGFHRIGRNVSEADQYTQLVFDEDQSECVGQMDNGATYNGWRMSDPKDSVFSALFDKNGIVAGVQAWWRKSEVHADPENNIRFDLLPTYQNATRAGEEYYVQTAYFVDPSTICTTGRTYADLVSQGTGTGVWIQRAATAEDAEAIPSTRPEAIEEGWSENSCFPAMGKHNFYRIQESESHQCTESEGWFFLYNRADNMIGMGFRVQGIVNSTYTEYPSPAVISAILGPPVPQCILDSAERFKTTTMHIYFVDTPWSILCPA